MDGGEPPPVLTLRGFGLGFGDRTILNAVDFIVPANGCTVLLGPSGTGKSSLLRTLAGFNDNHPALRRSGEVLYGGSPISPDHRPALVMQKAQLMVATVLDNLQVGLPDRSRLTRPEQIERITSLVETLGEYWVVDRFTVPVIELSLVQQRRVAILRELMWQPKLLMIDEPTTGLSDADAVDLLQLIKGAAQQRPILLVLHHLGQARTLANWIVLLASGHVQEMTSAMGFFSGPSSEAGQAFLRTGSCPEYPLEATTWPLSKNERVNEIRTEAPESESEVADSNETRSQKPIDIGMPLHAIVSAACGPRGYAWLLPGQLAGTPWPGILRKTEEDLDDLRHVGVTRLVNLTEEPFDAALAKLFGITCSHLPIVDMHAPTVVEASSLCADLDQWIASGEIVALHCRAGLGRTGTLLAAYWLWRGNGERSALESVEFIRRLNTNMIQSEVQVSFLSQFASSIGATEAS